MQISADQCRAARGLLNWTQSTLATNAGVSRVTIADFESRARMPLKNNLSSIEDCMFAAGVEFLAEEDGRGLGVRFRERKLQFISKWNFPDNSADPYMRMSYAGKTFSCFVSREAIDDYYPEHNFRTMDEYVKALSDIMHVILAKAEKLARDGIHEDKLLITSEYLCSN
ncbi:MAG: helix-turn-helix domain-containing protein [Mangrovicoccus sp.]|nr:helix-turn-helix domain-containing protein [Mangrovicoccus sp.]